MKDSKIKQILDNAEIICVDKGSSKAYFYLRNNLLKEVKLIKIMSRGDERHIIESENNMCVEHGYSFPCPVCDGDSDS
jgi:UDP-glucose 4-epimerase